MEKAFKFFWVYLLAALVLFPQHVRAVGACTCARFNLFRDHGCHCSPGGAGASPSGANNAGDNNATCPTCPPSLAGGDASDIPSSVRSLGMPRWWVNEPYINLHVVDEPISYKMSSGKDMTMRFIYKQDYEIPKPDQIPTFYNTYFGVSRDLDTGPSADGRDHFMWPYIHSMNAFAGPYAVKFAGFQQQTNGMTNAAWMHNFQEFIILWDKQWEDEYNANGALWPYLMTTPAPYSDSYEALVFMPDGGVEYFNSNASDQTLNPSTQSQDPVSGIQLHSTPLSYPTPFHPPVADGNGVYWGTTTNTMSLAYPDGSQDIFGLNDWDGPGGPGAPDTTGFGLLTERIDPQGRITKLGYIDDNFTNACDSGTYHMYRLHYVIDPDGRTNTFVYSTNSPSIPSQLQEIDDPFGRKATFQYENCASGAQRGWLTSITDAQGISNSFTYNSGNSGWMSSLITPYGTNNFYYQYLLDSTDTSNYTVRAIYVTEPDSSSQLFGYRHKADTAVEASATPPTVSGFVFDTGANGGFDQELYHRNSFYWDRSQTANLISSGYTTLSTTPASSLQSMSTTDLRKGRMRHWLLDTDGISITEALSSERDPSPDSGGTIEGNRTWYAYTNQTPADVLTSNQVGAIAVLLPDGSTQYTRYGYYNTGFVFQNAKSYSLASSGTGELISQFFYAANGVDLTEITNSLGQSVNFGYNSSHQVVSVTNALRQITQLAYNSGTKNLTNLASFTGRTVGLTYNATNPISSTSAFLNQITVQPENRVTYISDYTNALPRIVQVIALSVPDLWITNTWDNLNRLTGSQFQDGTTISNTYNILDLSGHKNRLSNWTYYTYDGLEHLTSITDTRNNITQFEWCDCGALTSISNALGKITSLSYNNQGSLTNVQFPDLSTLSWLYDTNGRMTNVFDGLGNSIGYFYNNQDLVTSVQNAYGQVWGAYRDALGRPATITNINSVVYSQNFDLLNRITNRTWSAGGAENFGYSSNGLVAYTNQDTQWTHYGRDGAGRLIALTNAIQTNLFGWDGLDNLTNFTDGLSHSTTWLFNQYGWLTSKSIAGSTAITYQQDSDGRVTNRWMMGTNTQYVYDAVGNLASNVYPNQTITYKYDAINELTNVTDAIGTTIFAYTASGLPYYESGPWASDTVTYTYSQGHRTGLSLGQPTGPAWSQAYSYDSAWRMTGITSPAGSFSYILGGSGAASPLIKSLVLPNYDQINNTYDSLARLTGTSLVNPWGNVLDGYVYGMDSLGLRTNITRNLGLSTNIISVAYDPIGELTNWMGKEANGTVRHNEQLVYSYDAAGNLNSRTNDKLVETFTVNSLNELTGVSRTSGAFTLTGSTPSPATTVKIGTTAAQLYGDFTFAGGSNTLVNGVNNFTVTAENAYGVWATNNLSLNLPTSISPTFDNNGNMTSDETRTFQYDAENELTNVSVATTWQVGFIYDGLHRRRITKQYAWQGGAFVETNEIRYVYDGLTPIQERDTNNNVVATYTRGVDLSLSLQGAGGVGGLLARTDSTGSYFYHNDGSGNVTALVDISGNIQGRAEYDAFGKMIKLVGPMATKNTYWYSGKEYIPQAGLYGFSFRFYEPNFQRWLNRDPFEELGGPNLFGFVGNSPINEIDPFGLVGLADTMNNYGLTPEGVQGLNALLTEIAGHIQPGNGIAGAEVEGPLMTAMEDEASGLSKALKGSLNAATKAAASCGSKLHADRPGGLPDQLRSKYPETEFQFTPPGKPGQDVQVVGGMHPSAYGYGDWPEGVNFGDFKPNTPGGLRTFNSDSQSKWNAPTTMLQYDPNTGKLVAQ